MCFQWGIQDVPESVSTYKEDANLLFWPFFTKTARKWNFGPNWEGGRSLAPFDPPKTLRPDYFIYLGAYSMIVIKPPELENPVTPTHKHHTCHRQSHVVAAYKSNKTTNHSSRNHPCKTEKETLIRWRVVIVLNTCDKYMWKVKKFERRIFTDAPHHLPDDNNFRSSSDHVVRKRRGCYDDNEMGDIWKSTVQAILQMENIPNLFEPETHPLQYCVWIYLFIISQWLRLSHGLLWILWIEFEVTCLLVDETESLTTPRS